MQLLCRRNRDMEIFERDPNICGSRIRILRWRWEGHLILLKVEERTQSHVRQDNYARRVVMILRRVLLRLEALSACACHVRTVRAILACSAKFSREATPELGRQNVGERVKRGARVRCKDQICLASKPLSSAASLSF